MAPETKYHRYQNSIYTWSGYNTNKIPAKGEYRFFQNVISGQTNYAHMLGDGSSKVSELPFENEIEIRTGSNVDLEDLRITRNKVAIYNTSGGTITIEVGTSLSSKTINLLTGEFIYLYFNGTDWINLNRHEANSYDIGNLYKLPCNQVSTTWTILAQSDLAWTDADFSAYVETGERLKALLLYIRLKFTGDGALDLGKVYIRPNGSSEAAGLNCEAGNIIHSNLGAGLLNGYTFQHVTLCDENGIIEYQVDDAATDVSMICLGYYLKDKI